MAVSILSAAMTLVAFGLLVFVLVAPTKWADFVARENSFVVRCGIPKSFTSWCQRHEQGITLRIVLAALALVSLGCLVLSFYR